MGQIHLSKKGSVSFIDGSPGGMYPLPKKGRGLGDTQLSSELYQIIMASRDGRSNIYITQHIIYWHTQIFWSIIVIRFFISAVARFCNAFPG